MSVRDYKDTSIRGGYISNDVPPHIKILGNWEASTNTPTLDASTGVEGTGYYASNDGTQTLPFGTPTPVYAGDEIYFPYGGTVWEVRHIDAVRSVKGLTGDVGVTNVANQTSVTTNATNIVIGTVQDIGTGSSPTFANVTATNFNGTATAATTVATTATGASASYYFTFVSSSSSGTQTLRVDAGVLYNPSTNVMGLAGGLEVSGTTFTPVAANASFFKDVFNGAVVACENGFEVRTGSGLASKLFIDSDGNVLTNWNNVAQYKLLQVDSSGYLISINEATPAMGGTGTSTAFTAGSIVFAGAFGVYEQDNANFFYDKINKCLGIGTNTPDSKAKVHIKASGVAVDYAVFINNFGFGAGWGAVMQPVNSTDCEYIRFNNSAGTSIGTIASTGTQGPMVFNGASTNLTSRTINTGAATIGDGTNSYTGGSGAYTYTQIGNMVWISIKLTFTGKGSVGASSALRVSLPHTISASWPSTSFAIGYIANFNLNSTTFTYIVAQANGGDNYIGLFKIASGGSQAALLNSDYSIGAGGRLELSGFYLI
jgi:hypothetical protein